MNFFLQVKQIVGFWMLNSMEPSFSNSNNNNMIAIFIKINMIPINKQQEFEMLFYENHSYFHEYGH